MLYESKSICLDYLFAVSTIKPNVESVEVGKKPTAVILSQVSACPNERTPRRITAFDGQTDGRR
jgi:hypothetical protein